MGNFTPEELLESIETYGKDCFDIATFKPPTGKEKKNNSYYYYTLKIKKNDEWVEYPTLKIDRGVFSSAFKYSPASKDKIFESIMTSFNTVENDIFEGSSQFKKSKNCSDDKYKKLISKYKKSHNNMVSALLKWKKLVDLNVGDKLKKYLETTGKNEYNVMFDHINPFISELTKNSKKKKRKYDKEDKDYYIQDAKYITNKDLKYCDDYLGMIGTGFKDKFNYTFKKYVTNTDLSGKKISIIKPFKLNFKKIGDLCTKGSKFIGLFNLHSGNIKVEDEDETIKINYKTTIKEMIVRTNVNKYSGKGELNESVISSMLDDDEFSEDDDECVEGDNGEEVNESIKTSAKLENTVEMPDDSDSDELSSDSESD